MRSESASNFNVDPKDKPDVARGSRHREKRARRQPEFRLAAGNLLSGGEECLNEVVMFVRTKSDPHALMPALRDVVQSIDADLPLTDAGTMEESIHKFSTTPRFQSNC